jgi:hypothetical protein
MVQIVKAPLLSSNGDAFDGMADHGRFLVGVGEGKVLARGTDVGLSDGARQLLNVLAKWSADQRLEGALRFVQVEEAEGAGDCVEQALHDTAPGDLLFFLVPGSAELEAVKSALDAASSPDATSA